MFNISYGLYVLTANLDGKDNGCIINTVTQVTSDPNQISIAVNKLNHTRDMIAASKKFTASIISQNADFELFKRFGFQSGKNVDKFAGFTAAQRGANEAMIIKKPSGAARFAAMNTKAMNSPQISSAHSANIRLRILNA